MMNAAAAPTRLLVASLLLALLPLTLTAGDGELTAVKVTARQLPDLQLARTFHSAFDVGGELLVAGGHTDGFTPATTAEYLKDGAWHPVKMIYTHDGGVAVELSSGEILLGGGFEKPLGIGQTHSVERYDPATHRFEGFGCMDTRRAFAQAVELDSGHVAIVGNWYHTDSWELFDGTKQFRFADSVLLQRASPYVFRTARHNAMVIGVCDTRGDSYDHPTTVQTLYGAPTDNDLLATWQPLFMELDHRPTLSFIGDTERELYAYLMAVENREGQLAVALVRNGDIQLLPTACPLPRLVGGKRVGYFTSVIADRRAGRGYIVGQDDDHRFYILMIDYAQALTADYQLNGREAPLSIGYTEPLEGIGAVAPVVLTADGDLFISGGSLDADNFRPGAGAWLLCVGRHDEAKGWLWWPWALALLLAAAAIGGWLAYRRYRNYSSYSNYSDGGTAAEPEKPAADEALMARIEQTMAEQELYKRPDLKLHDVAAALNTNSSYITNCIRQSRGCTFPQFIAAYRVEHAKQLLADDPSVDFTTAYLASGFANETTFFRTFKRITGVTPKEWVGRQK